MISKNGVIHKKQLISIWVLSVIMAIVILVILEYLTISEENERKAYIDSDMLMLEIEKIIENTEDDRSNLEDFLKDIYLDKAKRVSYLIDVREGADEAIDRDIGKLNELADLLVVDEIHIYDEKGVLYSGNRPKYYGLTLDSGEQMAYFKPMLEDRSLSMSQEIRPNTAEGKSMLYAMCWNRNQTRMIQIGVEADSFPKSVTRNQIDAIFNNIPLEQGREIFLTEVANDLIFAATTGTYVGKSLDELGIKIGKRMTENQLKFKTGFRDNPVYCSVRNYNDYRIIVAQYKKVVDENIPITLVTFTEYLILVFIAMSFILDFVYCKFLQEKSYAMKDNLTKLSNRRAYDYALAENSENPQRDDMVFVSMDVNGLKRLNDQLGHETGDRLLRGAAYCIEQCYGEYGQVFRYGGDEFAAILYVKDADFEKLESEFQDLLKKWSQENGINLQISTGYARKLEYPDQDIYELAKIADREMYKAKAKFYSMEKHDRRGTKNEGK